MVLGGSGVLPWTCDEEGNAGHPNHSTLYPGEQGTGQGKTQTHQRIDSILCVDNTFFCTDLRRLPVEYVC